MVKFSINTVVDPLKSFCTINYGYIRTHGFLVPLTLSFEDNDYVCFLEDVLKLTLNLQIGTMYVEWKLYSLNGDMSKTILMQKKN